MKLHRLQSGILMEADAREALAKLKENSIDSSVTDPPYELEFMGKAWDGTGIAFSVGFWREVLRVLKPGAHLLAFGGTRTYHRMTCAIEDAGFEIRDSLHWFYGTGFPKSLNVAKAIDQSRTEDLEPVRRVCRFVRSAMDARGVTSASLAPLFGGCHPRLIDHWAARDTDSQPCLPTDEQWARLRVLLELGPEMDSEVARLNARKGQRGDAYTTAPVLSVVDRGDRSQDTATSLLRGGADHTIRELSATAAPWDGWGTALKPAHEPIVLARKPLDGTVAANVLRWGTGAINVDACRIGVSKAVPASPARDRVGQPSKGDETGRRADSSGFDPNVGRWPANVLLDEGAAAELDEQSGERGALAPVRGTEPSAASNGDVTNARARVPGAFHGDSGGASRFFYVAKPSRAERDLGCDALPIRSGGEATDRQDGTAGVANPRAGANRGGGRNVHPTVKPVELLRYLVRLVTPPGGRVLDPFFGSGTTGIAAHREGFSFLGVEREAEYVTIAQARVSAA